MLVVVGRLSRAHGVRGEIAVTVRTDEPERRFAPGASLVCDGRTLTVTSSRQHSGRLLVVFEEVGDRTAAEQLSGRMLEAEVDPAERPDDPEEFYDHQLVDLEVRAADDAVVGRVISVLHLPEQDSLVADVGGREVIVPFVEALVPEVDVAEGFVRLSDVPGLLDPEGAA